jgi:WD40 repeat protein
MSRLFLSHSSANNAEAVAIRDWLANEGWNEVFVDFDPDRGISAGERWERALNEAASRCEAVLFLVSPDWLKSRWCMKELSLAHKLNKRLFGILIKETPVAEVPADLMGTWQLVDLASGQDHKIFRAILPRTHEEVHVTFSGEGLARLRNGLAKAGLDPRFFAWPPEHDPNRPAYRGLKPLEAEDAGIFFGRDAPTVEALDTLRGLREGAAPRLLVILGASGAGKSSFLRAGLLPRLLRDDSNFIPLPVLRPERAALYGETGLVHSIETALSSHGLARPRAKLREAIGDGAEGLRSILRELVDKVFATTLAPATEAKRPTVVLAVDQSEELFIGDGAQEGKAFLELIHDLILKDDPAIIVLFTIRSDSYDRLETVKALEGIRQQTLALLPMPRGAYQTVIEGPTARLKETNRKLAIEPKLTQRLLEDIEKGGGSDALPLLAFTMEQLYLDYGAGGVLRLADYEAFGGIKGAIEGAVKRALAAADSDARIPRDAEARLALLRRGLIPWLAGIDPETSSPRRRVARVGDVPAEAAPLIRLLVEQRLLTTDRISIRDGEKEKIEVTVEPAHEALLRQWGLLRGWLEEDFAALTTLDGVKRASRDWAANGRRTDWLNHTGSRLEDAETVAARTDLSGDLSADAREYLRQCRTLEENNRRERLERLERERNEQERQLRDAQALAAATRRIAQRTAIGLIIALILAAASVCALYVAEIQRSDALVSQSLFLARDSKTAVSNGDSTRGTLLALAALPDQIGASSRPFVKVAGDALELALSTERERLILRGHQGSIFYATFSPDGKQILTAAADNTARLWSAHDGALVAALEGHKGEVLKALFSPDGTRIVTGSSDGTARLWDTATGSLIDVLRAHESTPFKTRGYVSEVAFSPDSTRLITVSRSDHEPRVWDAKTGKQISTLAGHDFEVTCVAFSADSKFIVTGEHGHPVRVWDPSSGAALAQLGRTLGKIEVDSTPVESVSFSPDGTKVFVGYDSGMIQIWDWKKNRKVGQGEFVFKAHDAGVSSIAFSPDAQNFVTSSADGTARTWSTKDDPPTDVIGTPIAILRGHQGPVRSAVYSPNGDLILTASSDNTARVWSEYGGKLIYTLGSHDGAVESAIFSPDGKRLLTASSDGTARIWEMESATRLSTVGVNPEASRENVTTIKTAAFSPDGTSILTASLNGRFIIWDARSGARKSRSAGNSSVRNFNVAAFSPDGSSVATGGTDKAVWLWRANGGTIRPLRGHDGQINAVAFSYNGTRLVTASDDKTARVWNIKTADNPIILHGHTSWIRSAVFSRDDSRILTVANDYTARIWDSKSGKSTAVLRDDEGSISVAILSPDGRIVLTGSSAGVAKSWSSASGGLISAFRGHDGGIRAVAFSPDANQFATASDDNTARVWDVRSGSSLFILRGHEAGLTTVMYSLDGSKIVTGSQDKTARIWDAKTGALLITLSGHEGDIQSATFSRDGNEVLTLSADNSARLWNTQRGSIIAVLRNAGGSSYEVISSDTERFVTWSRGDESPQIWDIRSGRRLARLSGHRGSITSLVIARDEKKLLTTSADRTARVWDFSGNLIPSRA